MAEESSSSIQIDAQEIVQQYQTQGTGINMMQFLKDYAPIKPMMIQMYDSELDFLRSVSGFREFVDPNAINFNYYFDEQSYAAYTKEQCALRLELTRFRYEFLHRRNLKYKDLLGYYYELGKFQTEEFRPADFDDGNDRYKPKEDYVRQGRYDGFRRDRR